MDYLVRLLNPLLMIAMPLALGIFLVRRFRVDWRLFGIGALTFLGSQVLHLPFNAYVLFPSLDRWGLQGEDQLVALAIVALLAGLSAGVFEEMARYVVYRRWLKDDRTWEGALMFGTGHGGMEAILLGGLALYALWQATALQGQDLSDLFPADQLAIAQAQLTAYWAMPWYQVLLGALERAAALSLHLSLTVLVLQAFLRRNLLWLGLAIGWHALVDAGAVFAIQVWGVYPAEALVFLCGLASLGITLALRSRTPSPTTSDAPIPSLAFEHSPLDPTTEQLEASRYD